VFDASLNAYIPKRRKKSSFFFQLILHYQLFTKSPQNVSFQFSMKKLEVLEVNILLAASIK